MSERMEWTMLLVSASFMFCCLAEVNISVNLRSPCSMRDFAPSSSVGMAPPRCCPGDRIRLNSNTARLRTLRPAILLPMKDHQISPHALRPGGDEYFIGEARGQPLLGEAG